MKRNYIFFKALAAFFLVNFTALDAQLTIITSGSLEPGGVSNNGVVAIQTSGGIAYKWDVNGGLVQIGAITAGSGAGRSGISYDGRKISSTMTNQATAMNEISLYDIPSSTWTNLGSLGSSSGGNTGSAWGISGNGNVVMGLGWISAGTAHAVKWQSGTMTDLGSIVAGRSSRANGASFDGSVIVGWQDDANGSRRGAKWVNGVESYITDNSGNLVGEASAASSDGNTIIGQGLPNPYVWNASTGLTYITHPNAGSFFRGGATGVSADGNTVIGYYRNFPGPPTTGEGFIWTPAGGRVELNAYAASLGINTLNVKMSLPTAISPDGKKIAGMGVNTSNNSLVVFYLDLTTYLSTQEGVRQNTDVSIYPNPVKDILYIKGTGKIEKAGIYNMVGQKIRSFDTVKDQLDVSFLPKGNYILEFSVRGKAQSLKFIKQ
ncbi:T9SS type A sorting domain-containing protein [Chryseobacterium daecheongense]|uniref:Secreted protein (Por secretion system target) n=1 Tax=Chryseobacterium daecheongense TaxID=192389 RepID=A0A3N0W605_9FLAO|nr:T9SS type A sorting domain-containing protein [Chryseobacterium daecheongense]ROI00443.1 T9SS C-terminal target domain-containing protein [Chryseobacterium daecheongense]TDX94587.1 putative secreted protein (Por secretion system target) [Chryseobacterium daecheongense]